MKPPLHKQLQLQLPETIIEEKLFKVYWKEYNEKRDHEQKFIGYQTTSKIVSTKGLMTIKEALSFVQFISEICNSYAGWHQIKQIKEQKRTK